ncbi:glutathionyl-hydroquinone reductase [Acrasis kona]|uniref:Glutathionyl-hydroquinone reductase n=1 Tax=Acrasis kona TaxID=1008807 RepID=A0AAW2ZAY7_9EUKA
MAAKGCIIDDKWVNGGSATNPTQLPDKLDDSHELYLYVSVPCPFAQSVWIAKELKNVPQLNVVVTSPIQGDEGWSFDETYPDRVLNKKNLHEVYSAAGSHYTGASSVPLVYDATTKSLASNTTVVLMGICDQIGKNQTYTLFPKDKEQDIKAFIATLGGKLNYFAAMNKSEEDAKAALAPLLAYLEELDSRLKDQKYIFGDHLTAADVRLFTILVRYELLAVGVIKAARSLKEYPNVWRHTKDIYNTANIKDTINQKQVRDGFYLKYGINPGPVAQPELDLSA